MFYFVAGNHFKHAINVGNNYLKKYKKPIINFAIEDLNNSKNVCKEYKNLIYNIPENNFSIAIKLSSFNFDKILINNIIDMCKEKNIKLFIDAENNFYNKKYQDITTDLMLTHNSYNKIIYKTYQMYRRDSLNVFKQDLTLCNENNIFFCSKLVRGAYWNTENKEGHLFINKEDTDNSYNKAIIEINNSKQSKKTNIILATHNKFSIQLGLFINNCNNNNIFEFAHLQGMYENYYNNISKNNNVHVYIPYGPYNKMIPYLTRRLYENMDILFP